MNVSWVLVILGMVVAGGNIHAADPLMKCLTDPRLEREHRLDREAAVRGCYERYKSVLRKDLCYRSLRKAVAPMDSLTLTEDIRSLCFYDAGPPARDIGTCLQESRRFTKAADHDEAVFYCYQQFQDKLNTRDCLRTARQLIFPGKEAYLRQHCLNNAN